MSGKALSVAAAVSGRIDPSSYFRVLQHVDRLAQCGVDLHPIVSAIGSYPPPSVALRPLWGAAALATRARMAFATRCCDATLLQRTMVSTLATFEGLCRAPRILDVDDAIHLHRGGAPARRVASLCDLIICGNEFLADWYARYGHRVAILPTAVDTDRWRPASSVDLLPAAGWIGSSGNLKYLLERESALRAWLDACPDWTLRVVCEERPPFVSLPPERWTFIPWSRETEAAETARFSIGLMPLRDSEWERGKCAFKMLLYMACGVPAIVSPVGMNADVLARGTCGLAAETDSAWTSALVELARDETLRRRMGAVGRSVVERDFSAAVIAPRLAALLRQGAGRGGP